MFQYHKGKATVALRLYLGAVGYCIVSSLGPDILNSIRVGTVHGIDTTRTGSLVGVQILVFEARKVVPRLDRLLREHVASVDAQPGFV